MKNTVKNTGNLKVTTPSDREIAMTRVFDAPRRLVFDAWTKPELLKRWLGEASSLRDFVIASPEELNEAEAVAEWISQEREFAPFVRGHGFLKPSSDRNSFLNRGFDFLNDKIKMDRCPVALVAPALRGCM